MKVLDREAILTAKDREKKVEVDVSEWWGGMVYVRVISGFERDRFEDQMYQRRGKDTSINMQNFRARLCVLCIVDEQGKRLFSDTDITELGSKAAPALAKIYDVASKLNGFSKEDVEELTKNSESGPSAASG